MSPYPKAAKNPRANLGGDEPRPFRRPRQGSLQEAFSCRDKVRRAGSPARRVDEVTRLFQLQNLGATLSHGAPGPAGSREPSHTSRTGPQFDRELYLSARSIGKQSRVAFVLSTRAASIARRSALRPRKGSHLPPNRSATGIMPLMSIAAARSAGGLAGDLAKQREPRRQTLLRLPRKDMSMLEINRASSSWRKLPIAGYSRGG